MCAAVVPWDLKAVRVVYQGALHVDHMPQEGPCQMACQVETWA